MKNEYKGKKKNQQHHQASAPDAFRGEQGEKE